MKTRAITLVLLAAALQASAAAQTSSNPSLEVSHVTMRGLIGDTFNETTVALRFEEDGIAIRSANAGEAEVLKRLPYADILSADYSVRGTDSPGLGVTGKGAQRRLTIRCREGVTVLRLHKNNQKRVRRELAKRSGVRVEKSPYMSRGSFHWPAAI